MNIQSLNLSVGPLSYRLIAHDTWAADLLDRIRSIIDNETGSDIPQKQIHMMQQPLCEQTLLEIEEKRLPKALLDCAPEALPLKGWDCRGHNILCQTWQHPSSSHLFWTEGREEDSTPFNFHLPWQIILEDILEIGGVILHGGLAIRGNNGCVFTAPPGGGKSTTLSKPPQDWQVLSDDATLLWSNSKDQLMASPLPTWSVLIGESKQPDQIKRWLLSRQSRLSAVVLLEKSDTILLTRIQPIKAVYPLYRACSEYPAVLLSRHNLRVQLFHNVCSLVKNIAVLHLKLTRGADIWPFINEHIDHGHAN